MLALEGVAEVDFDCKVAVIKMKPGSSLTEETVTAALKAKNWGVKEFKTSGEVEKLTVHLFQVTGAKPADHDAIAKRLASEVKGATEVVIDSAGNAVIVLAKGSELTAEDLAARVKAAGEGYAVKAHTTKSMPATMTTYVVSVPGMAGAAEAAKVRETLAAMPKVASVQVFEGTKTAQIRLNEPCAKIAEEVTAALKAKGLESSTTTAPAAR